MAGTALRTGAQSDPTGVALLRQKQELRQADRPASAELQELHEDGRGLQLRQTLPRHLLQSRLFWHGQLSQSISAARGYMSKSATFISTLISKLKSMLTSRDQVGAISKAQK